MTFRRWLLVLAFPGLLAACGEQMPPLDFAVPNVGPSPTQLDAEVKSITIEIGRPDEQTGPVDVSLVETSGTGVGTGNALTSTWRTALEDSLDRMALFRDDAHRRVSISVRVLKLAVPDFASAFTTEVVARYEVIDLSNGSIIFRDDVASQGTTPFNYAYFGATRARESVNRAVQNNIASFLQQVQTVDLDRPMFPAPIRRTQRPAQPAA